MMIYSMFKRFSTSGELHQGRSEGGGGVGVGGWGETGTDRFDKQDDLHYVQAIFDKWGTSPG